MIFISDVLMIESHFCVVCYLLAIKIVQGLTKIMLAEMVQTRFCIPHLAPDLH